MESWVGLGGKEGRTNFRISEKPGIELGALWSEDRDLTICANHARPRSGKGPTYSNNLFNVNQCEYYLSRSRFRLNRSASNSRFENLAFCYIHFRVSKILPQSVREAAKSFISMNLNANNLSFVLITLTFILNIYISYIHIFSAYIVFLIKNVVF